MAGLMDARTADQDGRYLRVQGEFSQALERLARAYEANPDHRRDLLQDIHVALWRSFGSYDGRCSERTWVYRVAHNVGASHVASRRRATPGRLVSLEELADLPDADDPEQAVSQRRALDRLMALVRGLKPPDRQVMLLYLEDFNAAEIGEVTGMSAGAVATKVHRAKALLARRFQEGGHDD
jgi:RNA polymerase sigma-70 factor (ECF subfamily)